MKLRTTFSLLTLGLALAAPVQASRSFCCSLDDGNRSCGDVLPEACRNRAYVELNERGVRVRSVEAPLNASQQAARDAQLKKQKEADLQALDQKRRDTALLATYATDKELDRTRDRLIAELERSIKNTEGKLAAANKEKTKLAKDGEFYKGKLPNTLTSSMRRNQMAIEAEQQSIQAKKKEIEQVTARFEADRKRLQELRGGAPAQP
ncbi:hypothetical protein [Denitratisoma oestradiolicum]|uniref:DUF4124 domain-containing protein n=1 Tax=Denitratisoma oestradiolicum TaxID=311182 RepID=A0A6S6XY24_9PROT|nr:hypothetical protein [Denitratisoma oestradiolicum]TWO81069.1 hypothetical protein CBW56_05520 [Denitratisoma oestradiolicum]CAB1367742.1 conserved exported protein of unknown function [Denitratisoma oestradiolicum]